MNVTLTPFGKLRDLGFGLGDVDSLYSTEHLSFPADLSSFLEDLNFDFALLDRTLAEMDLSNMTRCRVDVGTQPVCAESERCAVAAAVRLRLAHLHAGGYLQVSQCTEEPSASWLMLSLGRSVQPRLGTPGRSCDNRRRIAAGPVIVTAV